MVRKRANKTDVKDIRKSHCYVFNILKEDHRAFISKKAAEIWFSCSIKNAYECREVGCFNYV